MKVAVVGGCGFVGRHVVRRLLAAGARVVTVDRHAPGDLQPGEEYVESDIGGDLEPEAAAAICGRTEAVVWLAALIRHRSGVDETAPEDLWIMVEAPLRFLAALEPPPANFAYLSSIQVYGAPHRLPVDEDHPTEPFTAYGVAKLCAEQYLGIACRARRTALASLRVAFIYGPGQHRHNVIPKFLDALRRREPPSVYGAGEDVRDDIYVDDVARAVELAIEQDASGVFNVASGRPHTVLQVAEAACRVSGTGIRPRHVPVHSQWVDRWFDVERARRELSFEATTSLDNGLLAMWRACPGE